MPIFPKKSTSRFIVLFLFVMLALSGIGYSIYLVAFGVHDINTLFIAMIFLSLTLISGFFNIFIANSYYRSAFYNEYLDGINKGLKPLKSFPTVAIVVPVFNEEVAVVKTNVLQLKTMNYPKERLSFYLLDDSTDSEKASELRLFARSNGIRYVHRKDRKGFKAGALNNMLKHSKEEFLAVFDFDEYLTNPNFLVDSLPYFSDKKLSYIQTEKRYFKGTFFSDTVDLFDAYFFQFVQPSRALNNTAIFAGSCGLLRRSAVDAVGGFPEYIIEDTFFSFESDMHDFKSLYLPKVYAYGQPITTFTDLVKQQWRYNYGDTQFLFYFMNRIKQKDAKKQSLMSKIDYFTHGCGLNYVSVILLLFTLMSILVVFYSYNPAGLTLPMILHAQYVMPIMELLGISTFAISIIAPVVMTKLHFKSIRKGFMVFVLNFSLSFIRAKAALAATLGIYPSSGWAKGDASSTENKAVRTLRTTVTETTFASALFVLGALALVINNAYGAVWLLGTPCSIHRPSYYSINTADAVTRVIA